MSADVDALIAEGLAAGTEGWDFDRFPDRMVVTPPAWDYEAMAADTAHGPLLDMGTGGGEWLARWLGGHRPSGGPVVAAESWAPNVSVAGRTLGPLGVVVVRTAGATDNVDQELHDRTGQLPFLDGSFPTVLNRHESYRAAEVARVLSPGGTFLTEQVASDGEHDLRRLLDLPPLPGADGWTLRYAVDQAALGGLTVLDAGVGADETTYFDVAPLVWFLRQAPWILPDIELSEAIDRLRPLQARLAHGGSVRIRRPHFWFRATRRPE